jgi:hypothetical protein
MNRSKDLDTIAPDDPILVPDVEKSSNPKTEKKPNPIIITDISDNDEQKAYNILGGHSSSSLSSFLVNPKVLSFSEREEDEKIYLAARPHWITNLPWIIIFILMLFIPLFFHYFSFLDFFPIQYRFSAVLFWYLITFISAFEKFLSWYFDLYLVTNKRVVDIDFKNMLNKHFAQADLSAIQDVSSSVKGILGTFFNYGDVLIQTAAEINEINFEKVPNPAKIIKLIKELKEKEEHQGGLN